MTITTSVLITALCGIWLGLWQVNKTRNAANVQGLVNSLITAEIQEVPRIIEQLSGYSKLAEPYLNKAKRDTNVESPERFRIELAMLDSSGYDIDTIRQFILNGTPDDIRVIRSQLKGKHEALSESLWASVETSDSPSQLLNLVSVLAHEDADNPSWKALSDQVVEALLAADTFETPNYVEMLDPIGGTLKDSLLKVLQHEDENYTPANRDLVASIANKFYGDDVNLIVDFLLESDPSQFKILVGSLKNDKTAAIDRLKRELESEPEASWNDKPLDPNWSPPSEQDIKAIEQAGGIFKERFALCQSMSIDDFATISESLRGSGYRPTRCRPYLLKNKVNVSAIWTRDHRDWRFNYAQTETEFRENEKDIRKQNFKPIDVTRYVDRRYEKPDLIASVWVKKEFDGDDTLVFLEEMTLEIWNRISPLGYNFPHAIHRNIDSNGRMQRANTAAKIKIGGGTLSTLVPYEKFLTARRQNEIYWDLCLTSNSTKDTRSDYVWTTKSVKLTSEATRLADRMSEQLRLADELLRNDPSNLDALRDRAIANHCLQRDQAAVRDLSRCFEANERDHYLLIRRCISNAKLGKGNLAHKDLHLLKEVGLPEDVLLTVDAVVAIHLGEFEDKLQELDSYVARNPGRARAGFYSAHSYAVAALKLQNTNAKMSRDYALRAIDLIRTSYRLGSWLPADFLQQVPEFDILRGMNEFDKLLQENQHVAYLDPLLRVDAQFQINRDFESRVIFGSTPENHLELAANLAQEDFRPQSISSFFSNKHEKIQSATIWHRPLLGNENLEEDAKLKSLLVHGLIQIGAAELAWPELAVNENPRLRSWTISRAFACGLSPDLVFSRLQVEKDPGIRQALILMLGEIEDWKANASLIRDYLLDLFENDPDSIIHSATEWALREHEMETSIRKVQRKLSEKKPEPDQTWHVSKSGHTMIEFKGPVEFRMGNLVEGFHQQSISRSFAIAAKELTIGQTLSIQRTHPNLSLFSTRYLQSPVPSSFEKACGGFSWVGAAIICRLLSEMEGVPENDMCFPPIDKIHANMVLPRDYLQRTGYRLPTQSEWEYAARGGTITKLPYGSSDELLPQFAWVSKNAQGLSQPVGRLKPNEFGLFDSIGNATEYTVRFSNYVGGSREDLVYNDNSQFPFTNPSFEITRSGPSFFARHRQIDVSQHWIAPKESTFAFSGIRLARTIRDRTPEKAQNLD